MMLTQNFSRKEIACKCGCDTCDVDLNAVYDLQQMRSEIKKPFIITSAYRCENHPVEAAKEKPGTHNKGVAFDIACDNSVFRFQLINAAIRAGAKGIGVHEDFIHVDFDGDRDYEVCWKY